MYRIDITEIAKTNGTKINNLYVGELEIIIPLTFEEEITFILPEGYEEEENIALLLKKGELKRFMSEEKFKQFIKEKLEKFIDNLLDHYRTFEELEKNKIKIISSVGKLKIEEWDEHNPNRLILELDDDVARDLSLLNKLEKIL